MTDQLITPEIVAPFAQLSAKPLVTISSKLITFNQAATQLLSLKLGDKFAFFASDYELYYVDSAKGFEISSTGYKNKISNAVSQGIMPYLKKQGIVKETESKVRYELGEFKEGRRHLTQVPIVEKPKK